MGVRLASVSARVETRLWALRQHSIIQKNRRSEYFNTRQASVAGQIKNDLHTEPLELGVYNRDLSREGLALESRERDICRVYLGIQTDVDLPADRDHQQRLANIIGRASLGPARAAGAVHGHKDDG